MLYLTSSESEVLKPVRTCRVLRRLKSEAGIRMLLVELDPPLGDESDAGKLSRVILAPRHQGVSLAFMLWGPVYVHVAKPPEGLESMPVVPNSALQSLYWAEVYRTHAGAARGARD